MRELSNRFLQPFDQALGQCVANGCCVSVSSCCSDGISSSSSLSVVYSPLGSTYTSLHQFAYPSPQLFDHMPSCYRKQFYTQSMIDLHLSIFILDLIATGIDHVSVKRHRPTIGPVVLSSYLYRRECDLLLAERSGRRLWGRRGLGSLMSDAVRKMDGR